MSLKNICTLYLLSSSLLFAGWHDRKAEGWAWYEDRKEETLEEPPLTNSPSVDVKEARDRLEELLSKALLNPTDANVLAYMEEQQKWVEKSSKFATVWTHLLLDHPELDETVKGRPVTQYGLQFHKDQILQQKEKLIHSLALDHGLMFLYEGRNPASIPVSNVVRDFSKKYGWQALFVSVDGDVLEEFPDSKVDNGIAREMGIQHYPALIVVDPIKNIATPVAYGLISADKIEENLILQFK